MSIFYDASPARRDSQMVPEEYWRKHKPYRLRRVTSKQGEPRSWFLLSIYHVSVEIPKKNYSNLQTPKAVNDIKPPFKPLLSQCR